MDSPRPSVAALFRLGLARQAAIEADQARYRDPLDGHRQHAWPDAFAEYLCPRCPGGAREAESPAVAVSAP